MWLSVVVGIVAAVMSFALIARPGYPSDFYQFWMGARTLLVGGNPYATSAPSLMNPGGDVALYPLPTLLFLAPFALAPLAVAGGLFMGLSSGLAAWGIARTGVERLPIFASAPFLLALSLGQWSPLLVATLLVPAISGLIVLKPNVGVAAWIARPSWKSALVAVAIVALSLLIRPGWPAEWLHNISGREEKFMPLLRPGGFLLAAGLLAWKRPEGRLFLGLIVVPQALFFYDQLLLWLVPRTLRQSLLLSIWSVVAFLWWRRSLHPGDFEVRLAIPYAWSMYLAALSLLLWNWWRDRVAIPAAGGSDLPEARAS
jgi:hypothetical protein